MLFAAIENIVRRHHPRTLVRHAARLNQRIQRDDVQAAEDSQPEDVHQYPPGRRLAQQCQPVHTGCRLRMRAGMPPEQPATQAQADRPERNQTDFNVMP